MQTDATTPNIVGPADLGAVASVLAVVCKCGCNNSQQRWPIMRVGLSLEVVALLSPRRPRVMHVRVPNNVGRTLKTVPTLLFYFAVITEQKKCWELLAQKFDQFQTLRNNSQQHSTIFNRGCKRMQHVDIQHCWELLTNTVASVCVGLYFLKRLLLKIAAGKLILGVVYEILSLETCLPVAMQHNCDTEDVSRT